MRTAILITLLLGSAAFINVIWPRDLTKTSLRRFGIGIVALMSLGVTLGAGYEVLGRRVAKRNFPPPGRLIDIGGRRMHLDCRGTGTPIVVLETGLDYAGSLGWHAVHDSIANITRACAYDRAGIMWSERSEGPRNAATVAQDLHETLERAGERPPFVLVGQSLGGPYSMSYTKRFPDDVAGLVFVDASHPDQLERLKAVLPDADPREMVAVTLRIAASLPWTGLVRALVGSVDVPHLPPDADRAAAAHASTSMPAMFAELDALDSTLADAGTIRDLGDRPLVVLTATAPLRDEILRTLKLTPEQAVEYQHVWKAMHEEEALWSTNSRHELVPDASHYIQFDRPDVVISAVRGVVGDVRASSPR
jgi:pimeloyl-ACP methyl ester carboxylesterase